MSQCGLINRNSNLTSILKKKNANMFVLYKVWLIKKKFVNDQRDGMGTPEFWPSTALRYFSDDDDLRRITVYQQLTLTVARS